MQIEDTVLKRCSKCKAEKPATLEFFGPAKKRDGSPTLKCWCRPCHSAQGCAAYHAKPETKELQARLAQEKANKAAATTRQCSKCGEVKPLTTEHFYWRRGQAVAHCIPCDNAAAKEWREANPEKAREIHARYYGENKAAHRARDKAWREANPEKVRVARELWHARNPSKMQTYRDRWAANNGDRLREMRKAWALRNKDACRLKCRRYRARKLSAPGSHTVEDVKRQYEGQKGKCYWCQQPVGQTYHVDHIFALARGGSDDAGNICISCPNCNHRKNAKEPYQFAGRLF